MSSWEDTVMSDKELAKAVWGEWNAQHIRVAQAQAEISFKAGQEAGYDIGYQAAKVIEHIRGKQEGIREVVEWVKKNMWKQGSVEKWQAKLKEWGVK